MLRPNQEGVRHVIQLTKCEDSMLRWFSVAAVILLLAPLTVVSVRAATAAEYGHESEQGLFEAIRSAIRDRSKEGFLRCSCWERLTDRLRKSLQATTPAFMTKKAESIKLVSGGKDPYEGFEGFEYNIEYKGYIEVEYEGSEDVVKMPYGVYKGRFYLATMVAEGRFPD